MAKSGRTRKSVVDIEGQTVVLSGAGAPDADDQPSSVTGEAVGGFMLKPRPYSLTMPPPDDYYFVRADQLEQLSEYIPLEHVRLVPSI